MGIVPSRHLAHLLERFEHRRVSVRGRFELHDDGDPVAIYVSPRPAPPGVVLDDVPSAIRSEMSAGETGALMLTPFRRSDDGSRVLVHRGWVPKAIEQERLARRAAAGATAADGTALGPEETVVGVIQGGREPTWARRRCSGSGRTSGVSKSATAIYIMWLPITLHRTDAGDTSELVYSVHRSAPRKNSSSLLPRRR